jgi:hypothetical protein
MSRKTQYLGCFGYNDSPNELGDPAGFWRYDDDDAMWSAFNRAQMLDDIFGKLGEPTYSAVLLATDADGYVIFHLFVISVQPIRPREALLIEAAQGWIVAQGKVIVP